MIVSALTWVILRLFEYSIYSPMCPRTHKRNGIIWATKRKQDCLGHLLFSAIVCQVGAKLSQREHEWGWIHKNLQKVEQFQESSECKNPRKKLQLTTSLGLRPPKKNLTQTSERMGVHRIPFKDEAPQKYDKKTTLMLILKFTTSYIVLHLTSFSVEGVQLRIEPSTCHFCHNYSLSKQM